MLTYESATELLHLNLDEERELRLLSEAAVLRLQWRRGQVGLDLYFTVDSEVSKVYFEFQQLGFIFCDYFSLNEWHFVTAHFFQKTMI